MEVTTTPVEATQKLAAMQGEYQSLMATIRAAEDVLDATAAAAAKASLDTLLAAAVEIGKIIAEIDVDVARAGIMISAAAEGLTPKKIKEIATANLVSMEARGMLLPLGIYERKGGKGWCRHGTGANVEWAEKVDGKYLADHAGKWIVGCSDGPNKDQKEWHVKQVGEYWIAH